MSDHTEEIRARVEKATPGPWLWDGDDCDETQDEPYIYIPCKDAKVKGAITVLFQADWATKEDAAFAAEARSDVPYLLTALQKVEADRNRYIQRAGSAEGRLEVMQAELQALREENARLKGALANIATALDDAQIGKAGLICIAALSSSPAQEQK